MLADGRKLIVQVDASFTVTGTQTMTGHGAPAPASGTALSG